MNRMPQTSDRCSVLVVEDDHDTLEVLVELLNEAGFEAVGVSTAAEALEIAARRRFEVLLVDHALPDAMGPELIRGLRALGVDAPVILTSAGRNLTTIAKQLGARAALHKPFDIKDCLDLVTDACAAA